MFAKAFTALTAIMATSVLAAPQAAGTSDSDVTVGEAAQQCGNNQTISCCNSASSDSADGLLGGLLDGILGGNCVQIPVAGTFHFPHDSFFTNDSFTLVLGVQVPLNKACGNNIAACCQGDQNGLVNVQCSPISLL
ncbi:uncharacterized protein HMPREF1541_02729 [Cyphellophora europaea CBS 101466]|uniref:Hydrophobin n=1 Tax=Cyphellophora europaea (strain CBS 101466) TaxID=1220924 RepID=W2S4P7_CYPE1|nr:uncharacterized protein HMPREF1541_02729 [Cyphellophora europaea CBS 101466]ETN43570.1 hypothetical protein HMPREF1541_02729 [Cyphellophora europaea CBS 101466]